MNTSYFYLHSEVIGSDYVIICLYGYMWMICGSVVLMCMLMRLKNYCLLILKMKGMGESDVILGIKSRKTNAGFSYISLITLKKC